MGTTTSPSSPGQKGSGEALEDGRSNADNEQQLKGEGQKK